MERPFGGSPAPTPAAPKPRAPLAMPASLPESPDATIEAAQSTERVLYDSYVKPVVEHILASSEKGIITLDRVMYELKDIDDVNKGQVIAALRLDSRLTQGTGTSIHDFYINGRPFEAGTKDDPVFELLNAKIATVLATDRAQENGFKAFNLNKFLADLAEKGMFFSSFEIGVIRMAVQRNPNFSHIDAENTVYLRA